MIIVNLIREAIRMGSVFLFGCTGETLTEKSGHLNLGIPGIMCMGALGGTYGVHLYMSGVAEGATINGFAVVVLAILFSIAFSMLGGLIYAFLTVTLRANQNVSGLALTTFGIGFMSFFGKDIHNDATLAAYARASESFKNFFPFWDRMGWFGEIFFSHGILVYLGIIIALTASYVLKKTKTGLNLRAIGENPAAADAAGLNVTAYKYAFILIGSAVAGLGGLYYVMDKSGGTTLVNAGIDAFGWLSVALVIFTLWKPDLAILGSILFGGLYIASSFFDIPKEYMKIFDIVPYVVTVVVLIITSVLDSKENQPPAALGLSYFREER